MQKHVKYLEARAGSAESAERRKTVARSVGGLSKVAAAMFLLLSTLLVASVKPADAATITIYPECGDTIGDSATPGTGPFTPRDVVASAGDTLKLGWPVQCVANYVDAAVNDNTPLDGITIGANSFTFDLNGFSILGPTIFDLSTVPGDQAGILLNGRTSVTVTNSLAVGVACDPAAPPGATSYVTPSAVSGFDAGVAILNNGTNSGNIIEKLSIAGNVGLDGDYGEGIQVRDSDGNTIRYNNLVGNGPYSGITLWANTAHVTGNKVDCNTIAANAVANQDIGIRLEATVNFCTSENEITSNTITGSTVDGVSILNGGTCNSVDNVVSDNLSSGNGRDGIRLNGRNFSGTCQGATSTEVHGNVASANAGAGIRATNCSESNDIQGNTALDNNPAVVDHRPLVDAVDGELGIVWGGVQTLDPDEEVRTTILSVAKSPLLPAHGDLHDGNLNCDSNNWGTPSANTHVTEYAPAGSSTGLLPTDFTCIN